MDELAHLDGMAVAEKIRKKEVTPLEVVEATLRRIEKVNPRLNAVVTRMDAEARAAAAAPLGAGPLAGVPFLLKDLITLYAGVRLTNGSAITRDVVAPMDGELVARHKRAGLIAAGKTNVPELGLLCTTESRLLGPCKNPWDLGHSTGGSSGGAAAAVAAGIVPIAHGSDGGGSLRIPASCCGIFGLKPTRARNTLAPLFGDVIGGLVVEHAVTRSVRDSAAVLDATRGPAPGDPYHAPPPARPYLEEVGAPPGRLRIAFTTAAPTGTPVHPDCVAAVHDAARLCADLGHEVSEQTLPLPAQALTEAFTGIWAAGCTAQFDGLGQLLGKAVNKDELEPLTRALYEIGQSIPAPRYLNAWTLLQQVSRTVAGFMETWDVLLTPTLAEPPAPLGTFDAPPDNPMAPLFRAAVYTPFTPICNVTGQPAMSVPLYWNAAGLPIGAHFIGRFGDEATLFRLAAQLEAARPWAGRRPPVWAG
ncbi:MAG TPA: amidase family protein [Polyangia bacterium]|jgi:amidase|nr:amidase family protein [Polyangia bacterium]